MNHKVSIQIKRFDKSLPLPSRQTKGAAAYDVCARIDICAQVNCITYIPLNVALKIPSNYWVMIAARSSLHKRGLWLANGIGVVDSDYSGNEDECIAAVYNFSGNEVLIKKGERIAQLIIQPVVSTVLSEVEELDDTNRGAFGTTGH